VPYSPPKISVCGISEKYASRYKKDKRAAVYPVEFVVRAFLGTYPDLHMPRDYRGKRVLDLGFGDGRNMPLLRDLGMKVHGVEISEGIMRHVQKRLAQLEVAAELKVGTNAHIPYADGYFQYVLACHSCYYVESGNTFDDNLSEIARVLERGGFLIASLPMKDTYLLKGAERLSDGHYRISKDPYGLRSGTVFRAFGSEKEVRKALAPLFGALAVGFCDDMFWGIHQKMWTVVCRRK
jgi:ubiquinone/menaquinone biosynthesis C-methylase UbiE